MMYSKPPPKKKEEEHGELAIEGYLDVPMDIESQLMLHWKQLRQRSMKTVHVTGC